MKLNVGALTLLLVLLGTQGPTLAADVVAFAKELGDHRQLVVTRTSVYPPPSLATQPAGALNSLPLQPDGCHEYTFVVASRSEKPARTFWSLTAFDYVDEAARATIYPELRGIKVYDVLLEDDTLIIVYRDNDYFIRAKVIKAADIDTPARQRPAPAIMSGPDVLQTISARLTGSLRAHDLRLTINRVGGPGMREAAPREFTLQQPADGQVAFIPVPGTQPQPTTAPATRPDAPVQIFIKPLGDERTLRVTRREILPAATRPSNESGTFFEYTFAVSTSDGKPAHTLWTYGTHDSWVPNYKGRTPATPGLLEGLKVLDAAVEGDTLVVVYRTRNFAYANVIRPGPAGTRVPLPQFCDRLQVGEYPLLDPEATITGSLAANDLRIRVTEAHGRANEFALGELPDHRQTWKIREPTYDDYIGMPQGPTEVFAKPLMGRRELVAIRKEVPPAPEEIAAKSAALAASRSPNSEVFFPEHYYDYTLYLASADDKPLQPLWTARGFDYGKHAFLSGCYPNVIGLQIYDALLEDGTLIVAYRCGNSYVAVNIVKPGDVRSQAMPRRPEDALLWGWEKLHTASSATLTGSLGAKDLRIKIHTISDYSNSPPPEGSALDFELQNPKDLPPVWRPIPAGTDRPR